VDVVVLVAVDDAAAPGVLVVGHPGVAVPAAADARAGPAAIVVVVVSVGARADVARIGSAVGDGTGVRAAVRGICLAVKGVGGVRIGTGRAGPDALSRRRRRRRQ